MKWWPKLRRKPPSANVEASTRHVWSDGWPHRCTRCYQPRSWDPAPCAGRPEPITIDYSGTAEPGR